MKKTQAGHSRELRRVKGSSYPSCVSLVDVCLLKKLAFLIPHIEPICIWHRHHDQSETHPNHGLSCRSCWVHSGFCRSSRCVGMS